MDVDYGEPSASPPWNLFAIAVVATLRGRPGFHVAPRIAEEVAYRAMQTYLSLDADELLLAVYDPTNGGALPQGCALTDRRICWFDRHRGETEADGSRSKSRAYSDLPTIVTLSGEISATIDLGEGEELTLDGAGRSDLAAMAGVLSVLARGARKGELAGLVAPAALDEAHLSLLAVTPYPEAVLRAASESSTSGAETQGSSPRLVVTPLLIAACVIVAVAMAVSGVSATNPTVLDLYRWGAGSGMAEALNGEYWRLVTAIFLHGGAIHLAFNMWCLASSGRLVERLYGSPGFALLYLLSGIGGSLASAWWRPMVVGVGASGAIFGVIGGLGAFLVVHRAVIPAAVLRPMRSSTLLFVAYNLVPGFLSTRIDNAAHLGGLAMGFIAGLFLSRSWPVTHRHQGVRRQVGFAVLLFAALAVAALGVAAQVRRAPEIVALQETETAPARDFNALLRSIRPQLEVFSRVSQRFSQLLTDREATPIAKPNFRRDLDILIPEITANLTALRSVTEPNPETQAIRQSITNAVAFMRDAMTTLRRSLDAPDDLKLRSGPDSVEALLNRSAAASKSFVSLRDAYFRNHELESVP